ncbi:MAG TPA: diguanylate cyclase [Bryobacteraceae bacterium]|nr:diguanylate cyclase [Bryobacteraceae bacterium]
MEELQDPRRESPGPSRSFLLRYGCAVASVALATGVRLLLDPWLGDRTPFSILLFAVLLTAWYAGLRPALISAILGFFLADYFLIPPRGSLLIRGLDHWVEALLYLTLSLGVALLGGRMQEARLALGRNLQQTQKALSQTEARLNLALRSSGIGVWSWDIAPNIVQADENCSALFGLPIGEFPQTVEGFTSLLHLDDRERVQRDIAASLEHGAEYNTEFRVVWRDGTVRSMAARAKIDYGEAGRPAQFIGLCWDVTRQHQEQESLRQANEKLRQSVQELERLKEQATTLGKMNDLLQACSGSKEAYDIIAEFCAHLFPTYSGVLYIYSASRNLVNSVTTWHDPRVNEVEFEPDDCWALRRGQPHIIHPAQIGTRCRHLKDIPGGHACFPLMAQGTGLGILYLQKHDAAPAREEFLTPEDRMLAGTVAENIAISLSNLYLQEALRSQSIRDPLTGLFNRRYLEETFERELHRLARRDLSAGFAMLDLDHFKAFNDTFGHEGGDALLRAFGQFLREHLRKEDVACRYGGEEFCILFCESSFEDTVRRAEQLRSGVSRLAVQHGGQHLGAVTVSIGVASYPIHGRASTDLIAAADRALYQAKQDGRNRVVAATTSPRPEMLPQT